MTDFDVAIVGAGMAGASLAAEISAFKRVVLFEAETQPGYHATGRSAAFWTESYGGPGVQPLTTASGPFLRSPPREFSEHSFLRKRGALYIGTEDARNLAENLLAEFAGSPVTFEELDHKGIAAHVDDILPEWTIGLWESGCYDIDVAALHGAYLRLAKSNNCAIQCNAAMQNAWFKNGYWTIETRNGSYTAATLVNAAGAWADEVAIAAGIQPVGITPYRRTILQLSLTPAARDDLPLVIALDGSFYFKPDAGKIWLSPHDETPSPPTDAAPDDLDIAQAIDRFQNVVSWDIGKIDSKWAGLRSFAPDRLPVIGPDPDVPAFFWFAGQGGFGIQTAPAAAKLAASMLSSNVMPPALVDAILYQPNRLR